MKLDVEGRDIARWEDEVIVVNPFEDVRHPGRVGPPAPWMLPSAAKFPR